MLSQNFTYAWTSWIHVGSVTTCEIGTNSQKLGPARMKCVTSKRLIVPNQFFPDEPSSRLSAPSVGACAVIPVNMADLAGRAKSKSPRKSRRHSWKETEVKELLFLSSQTNDHCVLSYKIIA